jgi:hypothetical protein
MNADIVSDLTMADLQRIVSAYPPPESLVVAVELSADVRDWLLSCFGPSPRTEGVEERLYGVPIRIVEGEGICRPVYEHRPLTRTDFWDFVLSGGMDAQLEDKP